MLRLNLGAAILAGFITGEENGPPCSIGVTLVHDQFPKPGLSAAGQESIVESSRSGRLGLAAEKVLRSPLVFLQSLQDSLTHFLHHLIAIVQAAAVGANRVLKCD